MREIGVRQLKGSLSETLRAVNAGERVRVTAHGRPLADLVPVGAGTLEEDLQSLAAVGRLTLPTRPRPDRPPRLVSASASAAAVVLADRDAER